MSQNFVIFLAIFLSSFCQNFVKHFVFFLSFLFNFVTTLLHVAAVMRFASDSHRGYELSAITSASKVSYFRWHTRVARGLNLKAGSYSGQKDELQTSGMDVSILV